MPVPSLTIGLFIVLAVVVICVASARERRRFSRAGIGPASPGCPRCLYPLGGWSSPRCPECNCDVRRVGVRIAARHKVTRQLALVWLAAFGSLLALLLPCSWLFRTSAGQCNWFLMPPNDRSRSVHIATAYTWQRWPERAQATTTVVLQGIVESRSSVRPTTIMQQLVVTTAAKIPREDELASLIEACAPNLAQDTCEREAQTLRGYLVYHQEELQRNAPPSLRDPLMLQQNSGSVQFGVQWFAAPLAALLAVALGLMATAAVSRRSREGVRSPIVREWRDIKQWPGRSRRRPRPA